MAHIEELLKTSTSRLDMIKTGIIYDSYRVICGGLTSVLGYFLPIRDMVHLIIFFFIIDVAFGYWAAKALKGERFQVKIIWEHTMPRLLLSIVIMACTFMWDTVFGVEIVSTYNLVGWFISGILIASIAANGYAITKWDVFKRLKGIFDKRTNGQINNLENNGSNTSTTN